MMLLMPLKEADDDEDHGDDDDDVDICECVTHACIKEEKVGKRECKAWDEMSKGRKSKSESKCKKTRTGIEMESAQLTAYHQ